MRTCLRIFMMILAVSLLDGCKMTSTTPTPLPGWRSSVYQLLVDDSTFPQGWIVGSPNDTSTDPTANHIGRTWGNITNGADAEQAIWRSYSVADAQTKYNELLKQFTPSRPVDADAVFVELTPPASIDTRNLVADEMYLACGWVYNAYCEVVARYRNLVTDIRMDLNAEYKETHSDGLSYEEIKKIVMAMDAKFKEFLTANPLEPVSP